MGAHSTTQSSLGQERGVSCGDHATGRTYV